MNIRTENGTLTADQVMMGIQKGIDEFSRFVRYPIAKITLSKHIFSVLTSQLDASSKTVLSSEPMTVFEIPVEVDEQQATDFRIWPWPEGRGEYVEVKGEWVKEGHYRLPPIPPIAIKEVTLAHRSYDELSEYFKTHMTIK